MVTSPTPVTTALWPPDDTEESIVGVDFHQVDIITLRTSINQEAEDRAAGGPLPWQAFCQLMLLGCRRPDGSPYTVYPDVMVFPRPMDQDRDSYSLAQDGPPVLIVEVVSESTYRSDLDRARGKAWSYRQAGVREYLVLDPTRRFVPEIGRGWRLVDGVDQPWMPDAAGRWRSEAIAVIIAVEDGRARVYGAEGRRHLREREATAALEGRYTEGREEGRLEGREEGRLEGKRAWLRELTRQRFGVVAALEARIDAADEAALDAMLHRLLTATDSADL